MTETPMARELYTVDLEEGGDDPVERAFRFVGGVLTQVLGGYGAGVVGASVVVRRRADHEEVLRIDVPDAVSGDQVLQAMQQDLDTYPADEFVADWLERVRHGRHVAGHDAEGTRLE
ncbi:hypothetical protein E7744_03815 [Citricoccus sp. SGAir0253]|uniref:hypothetical protein n=1 Tax=Citricoccus sp. SGAir0253 TaxID=2567881 RepID=UPI0010CD1074|nr:hypothetical protein [Citricoccus sp. SGAir0253]QCU77436.1 hypothetical protein E7744_03815 [Citricoccus sp. SGAir0253]